MKKRGFTLIEIIAVIVILAIIALLLVPKVSSVIKNAKESSQTTLITTIEEAAKSYAYFNTLSIDYVLDSTDAYDIPISTLQEEGLLNTNLKYPSTGNLVPLTAVVRITKNGNEYNYEFLESGNPSTMIALDVLLGGGSTQQTFATTYASNVALELTTPTKTGYTFAGWEIVSGNSTLDSGILIIGTESTTIEANWTLNNYNLIVQLNGGQTTQTFDSTYSYGSVIELETPTKAGYTFNNWSVSGTNAVINNNVLRMGTNTTITANWNTITYSISYNLNGGTATNPASYNITTNTITLTNPTKTGYTFTGWTGSNGSTPQTTVTIPIGSTGNKTYTANWMASSILVTINGAINETITYSGTDSGTISTGSTGTTTATLKVGTYTFTSNVAKSTTSVSSYYSKSVTINGSTSVVNFYPDGAIYWYGNGHVSGSSLMSISGGLTAYQYRASGISRTVANANVGSSSNYYSINMTSQNNTGYVATLFNNTAFSMAGYTKLNAMIDTSANYPSGSTTTLYAPTALTNNYVNTWAANTSINVGLEKKTLNISDNGNHYMALQLQSWYYYDTKSHAITTTDYLYAVWRE